MFLIFSMCAISEYLIGGSAFYDNRLRSLVFAENSRLSLLGDHAFSKNQLFSVILPAGVKGIGSSAFSDNLLREEAALPAGIYEAGNDLFAENLIPGS